MTLTTMKPIGIEPGFSKSELVVSSHECVIIVLLVSVPSSVGRCIA